MAKPIRVIVQDLETGDTSTADIPPGMYALICAEPCHRVGTEASPGQHVITLRGVTNAVGQALGRVAPVADRPARPHTPHDQANLPGDGLGRLLGRARAEARLTQDDVANLLGWRSQGVVSGFERGTTRIHLQQLDRWAAALGKRIILIDIEEHHD